MSDFFFNKPKTGLTQPMKLLIIDERPMVRVAVRFLVKENWSNTEVFESDHIKGEQLEISEFTPDLILIEAASFSIDPILQEISFLRDKFPDATMGVYDFRSGVDMLSNLLKYRVSGCLGVNFDEQDLIQCLENLLRGKGYISNELIWDTLAKSEETTEYETGRLTPYEHSIAEHLVKGMRISEIAKMLNRKTSTISTLKKNIMKKMRVDNIIELNRVMAYH